MSGNSHGAYMLKLQKYKKMKNELNNQTKSIVKKVYKFNLNLISLHSVWVQTNQVLIITIPGRE